FLILCCSNLQIEIKQFSFNSNKKTSKNSEKHLAYIRIKLFNKITLVKIKLDNKKFEKIKKSKIINTKILKRFTSFRNILLENRKENLENIRNLNIKIDKVNLEVSVGLLDPIVTSISVAIISAAVSMLLERKIEKYSKEKCNYKIMPIYNEKVEVLIKVDCIINIQLVHIINILNMLLKKRRENYDERTSNRRSYVCRNE
ncbi:MAG: DUF2953 domain-containing protein, partial [Clostridia bacterium]|nr:DUF2953 domain-containing protein [Clostridia bacterium]